MCLSATNIHPVLPSPHNESGDIFSSMHTVEIGYMLDQAHFASLHTDGHMTSEKSATSISIILFRLYQPDGFGFAWPGLARSPLLANCPPAGSGHPDEERHLG
eukprot:scaffold12010_cov37-Prasinocladus_malaysianus.AAC.1